MANIITNVERYSVPRPDIDYYLVIGGHIPEVGLMLSFRRIGQRRVQRYGRKIVKCPHCSEMLTETDIDTKVEVYHKPALLSSSCQFHMQCINCKNTVGLSIVHSV
jgi:hypothetical protein